MTPTPSPSGQERHALLLDFPVRLYTALRTMRLYPAANPQVQRSNDFVLKSFRALLASEPDDSVTLALSDNRLLVCGEHLADKDHARPQVQGLVILLARLNIHSFTFHATFSLEECGAFVQTLSGLLGEKELTEPITTLLDKAGIASVSADTKRYVAIREGEQVVRGELIGSGLNISDEELANFVLGKADGETIPGVSADLVQELINRLPAAGASSGHRPEAVTQEVIELLKNLSREIDPRQHAAEVEQSAKALAELDPSLLAQLVATLPASPDADAVLGTTLHNLSPQRLNTLVSSLVARQGLEGPRGGDAAAVESALDRLTALNQDDRPTVQQAIAQNLDARQLLLAPETTLAELPDHLLQRLKQPDWSAPVLATAVGQVADPQVRETGQVDFAAFNRMLGHYEHMLDKEQQTQVARKAGAQVASMEAVALGNILAQRFKGLFGDQLYHQIVNQVSDELLDETIEHLTPKQLNRMIATLTSDIPLQVGKDKDPNFKPADDAVLRRLAQTKKGPEITKTIAQNLDARQLLLAPETTLAELPDHLLQRLKQPDWSAPVLATAVGQVADPQVRETGQVDFAAFNRMLGHYEHMLDKEQQTQVARKAGAQVASMEAVALGNILAQRFKGLFGDQLYHQIVNQVSDELLDETIEHLTPKQLNRMIATLTSDIPLQVGKDKDPNFKPADDAVLRRLAQTKKGPEITKTIAQNLDARLLQASPHTVPALPEQVTVRVQQPAWSAPVLVAAAQQSVQSAKAGHDDSHLSSFENLLARYDTLLDQEKQAQVASQVASQLVSFDEQELGLLLVRKYKSLFGEQLYRQVIGQLSEEKLEKLVGHFQALAEGKEPPPLKDLKNSEVEEAFQRLQQTVRSEKMRAIVSMYQQRKQQQEEQRQETIKTGLAGLLEGDLRVLEKEDLHQSLPETVRDLLFENKEETADTLLMRLAVALQQPHAAIRIPAFQSLAAIAEQLAHIGQWGRIEKLLPALQQGLSLAGISESAVQQTMTAIGGLAGHHIAGERYGAAAETAQILQNLSSQDTVGGAAANPLVREHALATLKSLCTDPVLETLLQLYLHSETHQDAAGRLLVALGAESAKFQLNQLINNESRFERKRLLALIKQTGNPALTILVDQLHKDPEWFVIRNVIRLLGEIGNPALFTTIKPFIRHADLRVQQEVIATAAKIGGDQLKDFLLHALQTVDDSLKIRVVNHIVSNHDERFVRPLTDLLESTKPFPGKNKSDLQLAICKALGAIGSRRANASLARVAQSKNVLGLVGYGDEVRQAAEVALEQIRIASASQRDPDEETGEDQMVTDPGAISTKGVYQVADLQAREEDIFRLVEQGRGEQAKEQLVELITTAARAGDFKTAERLRERIYEVDGLALGEIIRTGEIIEQEKKGAIKEEDLEVWAELTDRLSSDEFQTIYHELNEHRYKPEETIVGQGEKNDALFFITQGSVKVSHVVNSRELFITTLNRGQIAGENFFSPSMWTVTLTSLTPTRIHILPQSALAAWQEQFPGLRAKLHEYYLSCNTIRSMIEKKGLERRKDQRFTLSRKIQVQPISNLDNPIGRGFRAETADISLGGMAFLIRISRQENARLLLGRRMQVVLPVGGKTPFLHLKGLVIGIQPFQILENDFSVHFKFDHPLDQQTLQTILG